MADPCEDFQAGDDPKVGEAAGNAGCWTGADHQPDMALERLSEEFYQRAQRRLAYLGVRSVAMKRSGVQLKAGKSQAKDLSNVYTGGRSFVRSSGTVTVHDDPGPCWFLDDSSSESEWEVDEEDDTKTLIHLHHEDARKVDGFVPEDDDGWGTSTGLDQTTVHEDVGRGKSSVHQQVTLSDEDNGWGNCPDHPQVTRLQGNGWGKCPDHEQATITLNDDDAGWGSQQVTSTLNDEDGNGWGNRQVLTSTLNDEDGNGWGNRQVLTSTLNDEDGNGWGKSSGSSQKNADDGWGESELRPTAAERCENVQWQASQEFFKVVNEGEYPASERESEDEWRVLADDSEEEDNERQRMIKAWKCEGAAAREKTAYDHFLKALEENTQLRKIYLLQRKTGPFWCLVCYAWGKRKKFPNLNSVIRHANTVKKTSRRSEHRGYARAMSNYIRLAA